MTRVESQPEQATPNHRAEYRNDIDGLRAISVIAVILFHFGYLPRGYLGVDVFFVISGYLITGIIWRELDGDNFSIVNFYVRRIRRILPLTTAAVIVALLIGLVVMLPDDLENLSQSVIATNFFSNNILLAATTANYWDVINEYKPLMHTWSLGVEEQFYFLYPLLIFVVGKRYIKWFLPLLTMLAIASFGLYQGPFSDYQKFYFIQYRFWELASGGIAAIALKDKHLNGGKWLSLSATIFLGMLFVVKFSWLPQSVYLIGAVVAAICILVAGNGKGARSENFLLTNLTLVAIGKISFSLYMWHQIFLAYARYTWVQKFSVGQIAVLTLLILATSILSYRWIEQPFRDKRRVGLKLLLAGLFILTTATTVGSYVIYQRAGILREYPELGISTQGVQRNLHNKYNDRIKEYDRDFTTADKIKVLVIGDSFARDWANVLLESSVANAIELSYLARIDNLAVLAKRAEQADVIFYSQPRLDTVKSLGLPLTKLWAVGTKSFGENNGVFYNYRGGNYFEQRTPIAAEFQNENAAMRNHWGNRYLDLISKVADPKGHVPVFTPDHKFISQDCRHLTKFGAQYFAELFEQEIESILGEQESKPRN